MTRPTITAADIAHHPDWRGTLRERFASHEDIVQIPSVVIDTGCPSRDAEVGDYLAGLLADLGDCPLDSLAGARNAMLNSHWISHGHIAHDLRATGKPCIVLGAGPSADQWLDRVADWSTDAIVIVCDAMLGAAIQHGIRVDFVASIERDREIADLLHYFAPTVRLCCPPWLHPDAVAPFRDRVAWWFPHDLLSKWIAPGQWTAYPGRSSGTIGVALAASLGCDPIIMVGHDLGTRGGRSHAIAAEQAGAGHAAVAPRVPCLQPIRARAVGGGDCESTPFWQTLGVDLAALINHNGPRRFFRVGGVAEIVGGKHTEMAELAPCPPFSCMPRVEGFAASSITPLLFWRESIASCCESGRQLARMAERSIDAGAFDEAANLLAVSTWCSPRQADLFRYVTRSLYTGAMFRMHRRLNAGTPGKDAQAEALKIMVKTLVPLLDRMESDLCHD